MTRCALITGAQGFVGRYLAAELLASARNIRIIGIGRSQRVSTFTHPVTWHGARLPAPLPSSILPASYDARYEYRQADIRDGATVLLILREFRPDVVFHLASGLRDDAPQHLFATNVGGTIGFLELLHEAALKPRAIVIGSSGSVYGLPDRFPISENAASEPRDFYAVSKLAQEHAARIVARERGLSVVIARIFNIIGPGQDERHVAGRFAAQLAAVMDGSAPPCLQTGDLSTTRDFIDVRDVARALLLLARRREAEEVYNVANGIETPIATIFELLADAAGLHDGVQVVRGYQRPSDTPRVVADITRLHAAGYRAAVTLECSLRDTLDYYCRTVAAAAC
jgi:GDP-4-dehydro-6-deoxy-D-mannose reductase